MSSAAPSPSLRNLFAELEQLFQTETQARVSTSVEAAERALADHLNQAVRRLRKAQSFSEIAAVLCDASVPFAKACGVFRVCEGEVSVERARGAASDAEQGMCTLRFPAMHAAAFSSTVESREPVVAICSPAEVSAAVVQLFGHTPGDKACLFPLTVEDLTVGVLYATGRVENAALELLAQTAVAVLEARQPLTGRGPSAAASGLVTIVSASGACPAPATEWDSLSQADRNLHLRAQRFARVQVAEIRLYRPDAVKAGRARGDLYAVLQDVIDQARETFRREFLVASPTMVDYLHLELVRTLANDDPAWLGVNYPGPLIAHGRD